MIKVRKTALAIGTLGLAGMALLIVGGRLPNQPVQAAQAQAQVSRGPIAPTEIGMNLGPISYYSPERSFLDIIKSADLAVMGADGRWAKPDGLLQTDAGGHPVNVAAGTKVLVIVKAGSVEQFPADTYTCRMSPGWAIRPSTVMPTITPRGDGFTLQTPPPPARSSLRLDLTATKNNASLTELSCRPKSAAADAIFNPVFLADNKPFGVIRFMDWMRTNNQPPQTWATRTTPSSFTQAGSGGVAVEYMVALANTLGADPWFTVPLEADEAYYRNFAIYVRDHLAPGRTAYVEVSNEVWNPGFQQARHAIAEGQKLYPGVPAWQANDYFYADRVRAVMPIWTDVFKGQERRIVRVLATQAGNKWRAEAALSHNDTAKVVDALAIAPYFSPAAGEPRPEQGDATDYVLAHGAEFYDKSIAKALRSKAVAEQYGKRFITYEGGPGYVSGNHRLADAFSKAEVDPRMYGVYSGFLKRWKNEVGGLFMAYDSVNGHFGHKRYTGEPLDQAPKMRALVDFIAQTDGKRRVAPEPASTKR